MNDSHKPDTYDTRIHRFGPWGIGLLAGAALSASLACGGGGGSTPQGTSPTIVTHPADQTVTAPDTATFSVTATGNPAPSYQWQVSIDGGNAWSDVTSGSGATTASYTTSATTLANHAWRYRVIVENGVGAPVISNTGRLTVNGSEITLAIPDVSNPPNGSVDLVLKPIPAGSFVMGSPYTAGSYPVGDPAREVTIARPFYMAEFECTQAQWQAVMGSNPSGYPGADRPVEQVSYDDITAETTGFLARINAATASVRPAGMSFRLPTEAEWEYACRAGSTTNFFYGTDSSTTPTLLNAYAWFRVNPEDVVTHHAVGGKLPNAWGLHDMTGNVFELCEDDWHTSYAGAPTDGSAWIDTPVRAVSRVGRGGSFNTNAHWCQSHERGFLDHDVPDTDDGFRLVLAATEP